MLDKILGKKKNDKKDIPDLRGDKDQDKGSDIGKRLKDMVGKVTKREEDKAKKGKEAPPRRVPKPMPKPKAKKPGEKPKLEPGEKPRLKPPKRKKPMVPGGFGRKIPEEDQRTLVGAAVFGLIIIIIAGAGYYFLIYSPYQTALNDAKNTKFNEIETYFKGPLAVYPEKQALIARVDGAVTPEDALAVDVLGPATLAWREFQTQEIKTKMDRYGRVMVVYAAGTQKNAMIKAVDAQAVVNRSDATILSNMEIQTPDTVAVPIIITRLQAAGGLINVGNTVDVYNGNQTANDTSPRISGATVLAILRAKDSGAVAANMSHAQTIAMNQLSQSSSRSESATSNVEELLRAAASRNWDEATVSALLNSYGWRLSDFERSSNLGELDAQYLILLEVPRENAMFLIQNMNAVMLTVPTQQAPNWMIQELTKIYGSPTITNATSTASTGYTK